MNPSRNLVPLAILSLVLAAACGGGPPPADESAPPVPDAGAVAPATGSAEPAAPATEAASDASAAPVGDGVDHSKHQHPGMGEPTVAHEHHSPHGGDVQTVDGKWHYEVEFQAERLVVFLLDDKLNPLPVDGRAAKAVVQAGGKTRSLELKPEGLFLAAPLKRVPGEKVVAVVQIDVEGRTRSARFENTVNAPGQRGAPPPSQDHASHDHASHDHGSAEGHATPESGHGEHGDHP